MTKPKPADLDSSAKISDMRPAGHSDSSARRVVFENDADILADITAEGVGASLGITGAEIESAIRERLGRDRH